MALVPVSCRVSPKTTGGRKMLKDFKAFIARGNVLDLAVGVIIGAAFGKIVSSLTDDLIMPIVGAITGGGDFLDHLAVLSGNVPGRGTFAISSAARASVFALGT